MYFYTLYSNLLFFGALCRLLCLYICLGTLLGERRGKGWRGVDPLSAEGSGRVWVSKIERYSVVCFPLPLVTVYLTLRARSSILSPG